MSAEHTDRRTHDVQVAAPAGVVYTLIADAENWPLYFSENIHAERLEFDGEHERLRVWSLLGGRLESCILGRRLDPVERRIDYRHEQLTAPLDFMAGSLDVSVEGPRASRARLRYALGVVDDRPEDLARVRRAADHNCRIHIADLKTLAEQWTRLDELTLAFEESLRVNGPPELVYDFLYRAADWPGRVPHVTGADLTEDAPGVQHLTLRTRTGHGEQTTKAVRICFPHAGRIVYKETTPAAALAAHVGEWSVVPDETGVSVSVQHRVVLREETGAAGPDRRTALADTRRQVRRTLSATSRTLLALAGQHAKSAVRML
ncbi:cyclase [Streptomyces populi]|uniref:Cyclase n=1 Tax=Streptomyces populi TaxID=2058924 RepID=A0A2I0SH16_9ACTN|nr:SRPBCC family protein [Streptomyces populi]PKT69220.1 cyclase [Streptomyces populi]